MLSVAASAADEPPLLLLCDEPLVRSTVTLHEGRVTLVEQPASRARLYSTIRVLLTSPTDPEHYPTRADEQFTLRARRRARVWVAEIGGASLSPFVFEDESRGVVAVVPFEQLDPGAAQQAAEVFVAMRVDDVTAQTLAGLLGTHAGIIHLDSKATEWSVWWPRHDAPLWVSSPRRLPNFFPLHTQSHGEVVRLAASHGDVAAGIGVTPSSETLASIAAAMRTGGPTFLDALLTRPFESMAGCVIEVR